LSWIPELFKTVNVVFDNRKFEAQHQNRLALELLLWASHIGFDVLLTVDQTIRYELKLHVLAVKVFEPITHDFRLPAGAQIVIFTQITLDFHA